MGYRSQVVLAVGKEVMPGFLAALSKHPAAANLVFKDHDDFIKDYQGDGNILVRWDSIKWYEGYGEIDAIQAFVNDPERFSPPEALAGDADPWDCFKFIRVGEEPGDVHNEGNGFWDMYTTTSIAY